MKMLTLGNEKCKKIEKMAKITLSILFSLLLSFSAAASAVDLGIIPAPQRAELRDGVFKIITTTQITHDIDLRPSAQYLAEYLPLQIREYNAMGEGDIVLREDKTLAPEAYVLEVTPSGITIDASNHIL